jgi:hypothetical protein
MPPILFVVVVFETLKRLLILFSHYRIPVSATNTERTMLSYCNI